jgi:hypothetical protein
MTDRTPEQRDEMIDRLLALSAETARNISASQEQMDRVDAQIGTMAGAVEQLALATNRRLQQHDLELDDHDVRVERMERDHTEHADRMARLEEIQSDIRSMMQMLTRRLSGEPPAGEN